AEQLDEQLTARSRPGRGGLVFVDMRGGPLGGSIFNKRHWQPACQAAGLGCEVTAPSDDQHQVRLWACCRDVDSRHRPLPPLDSALEELQRLAYESRPSSDAVVAMPEERHPSRQGSWTQVRGGAPLARRLSMTRRAASCQSNLFP